jgi:hypothetical protein
MFDVDDQYITLGHDMSCFITLTYVRLGEYFHRVRFALALVHREIYLWEIGGGVRVGVTLPKLPLPIVFKYSKSDGRTLYEMFWLFWLHN